MEHRDNDHEQQHHRDLEPDVQDQNRPHHHVYDGKTDPLYDMSLGHFAACEALVQKGCVPDPSDFKGDWENVVKGLKERDASLMRVFWQHQANLMVSYSGYFKSFGMPIARIRRLMKTEELVQMISSEVLPVMAQAADLFVTELMMRAWMKARDNSRRTLQRSDVIQAAAESDMYDFLIDFLPREPRQEPAARRPSYSDPSLQHIRAPSLAPPLMHAPQPEYLAQSHPHLPQVAMGYHPAGVGIYAAPQQPADGDRGDPNERKAPIYSHNLYDSIPGAPRVQMGPPDGSLQ